MVGSKETPRWLKRYARPNEPRGERDADMIAIIDIDITTGQ